MLQIVVDLRGVSTGSSGSMANVEPRVRRAQRALDRTTSARRARR